MRIALKTYRDELLHLVDVQEYNDFEIDSIIDLDTKKWGMKYKDIPVISPFEAQKRYRTGQIEKVVLPGITVSQELLQTYYDEHIDFGYQEEDILFNIAENMRKDRIQFVPKNKFRYMDYLEFHTNDHCNLNCRYCNNYSNLVREPHFADLNIFEKDISRLRQLVDHIRLIRVLGGEPLLNKETWRFLEITRKLYPYAEINLVTNGILISQMPDKLKKVIRQTNTVISISAYPIMFDKLDGIAKILNEQQIKFKIGWVATRFRPPIVEKFGYPLDKVTCKCVHMRNGKIARCPLVQYLDYYNSYYGTSYEGSDGVIDLYDQELTFEKLEDKLYTPFGLCDCCGFWRDDLKGGLWKNDAIS